MIRYVALPLLSLLSKGWGGGHLPANVRYALQGDFFQRRL